MTSASQLRSPERWNHWAELLGARAEAHPSRAAVSFIEDEGATTTLSYAALWHRSGLVAQQLLGCGQAGERALLLFPPGIEFVVGFLACARAGWIAVPTTYPKPGRTMPRLDSAAEDCRPRALLADAATLAGIDRQRLGPRAAAAQPVATDRFAESGEVSDAGGAGDAGDEPSWPAVAASDLGLLQYTSGSTSAPKGVMVSHGNLMANLEAIRRGFGIDWQPDTGDECQTGVFWLPAFHDMGLIGGILEPLYVGGHTILFSPRAFLQRPLRWLQRISEHRALISGAPNFAYQLVVDRVDPAQAEGLDLSGWRIAFCGAEPIQPRTLESFANRFAPVGFSSRSFYPCYGLAEATLLAAGAEGAAAPSILSVDRQSLGRGRPRPIRATRGPSVRRLVACGSAAYRTRLEIVDPETRARCSEATVGEIWLQGDSIAQGYWHRPAENAELFAAEIADDPQAGRFFRSGDLGFVHQGQLYVTGRLKDVIILRGRNHSPQDIEATVRGVLGPDAGQAAALAVEGAQGDSLCIIAEPSRTLAAEALPELARDLRRAVIEEHEVDPRHLLLVRLGTVPLTSSGKVQRSKCRDEFLAGSLRARFRWDRSSASADGGPLALPRLKENPQPSDTDEISAAILGWILAWLVARGGVDPQQVDPDRPLIQYGLDSLSAVEMSGELEDWLGLEMTPAVAAKEPTAGRLAHYLAGRLTGLIPEEPEPVGEESGLGTR